MTAGRAADRVDAATLRADLEALVRMPSVTGDEGKVAAVLADRLEALGLTVEVFHPDPAAIRDDPAWPGEEVPRSTLPVVIGRVGPADGRRLVLSGHVDVVPPGDPATWTIDPWGADVRDGRLYGRGACDMKGGVAAILGALRALGDAGTLAALDGQLIVAFVPSEEDGGQGTLAAIRAGATGDMAVIAEPSNLDIVVAHAGAITFRLTVPGRAAHASRRTEGVSALANLQTLLAALEADEARRNAAETQPLMTALGLPYPTIVGIVAGGEWASTVMDRVTADGRYGVRLGQSPADAEAELRACIEAACAADEFLRDHPATVEITGRGSRHRPCRPATRWSRASRRPRWRRRAASRAPSASRTAATCACSSGSATRPVSCLARATCASPTRPTNSCRSTRSRRAPGSSPNG